MLINGTSAARRPKVGVSGAPVPKIGGGASKLSSALGSILMPCHHAIYYDLRKY